MQQERTQFIKHKLPCPKCSSSDAVSLNENGSAKCFSCNTFFTDYDNESTGKVVEMTSKPKPDNTFLTSYTGAYGALTDRGISENTATKFGVKIVKDRNNNVTQHIYPYFNGNEVVGTKTRFVANKGFTTNGTFDNTGLFGEQLYGNTGGKYLTITEGECDAMAVHELFQGKWSVVSLKRGASAAVKDIRESIEFVESFENVVLCFDNDKAGKEAAKAVAKILKPNKTRIMTFPNGYKDANEMLKQNKFQEFTQAWWNAKTYTPSGIMELSSQKGDWLHREEKESIAYPWEGLNKKLYGMRKGELVTLTGGTGLGKSSVTRELEHWLIKQTQDNVGIIALEEDWRRTIDGILSIEANARLYIDQEREKFSKEELDKMFNILYDGENKNRVWVHSHFGTNDIDDIFTKLRFMIIGCDCKWVVVDHLHMLVSAVHEGDERRAIDSIMTRLRSLVEETGAGIILVSHLRRVDGNKGHENGIEVSLSHLRGSNSIGQLSDCVIALERNQQSDDPDEARTTRMRILKSRYTGDVGMACRVVYDGETGRLSELTDEDITFDNSLDEAF